jgi:hypothetical protein
MKTNIHARPVLINFNNPTEPMHERRRDAIKAHRNGERRPVAIRPLTGGPTPCPGHLDDNPPRNY